MTKVRLEPIGEVVDVSENSTLLSILMHQDLDVLRECGGRGMCATCHIYVKQGMESLSRISRREMRTLEVITSCRPNSRLACQTRVQGEGIVIELPPGMYVQSIQDIEILIGRRADQNLLHPVTGKILVEAGKLVTRSMLKQLKSVNFEVSHYFNRTHGV